MRPCNPVPLVVVVAAAMLLVAVPAFCHGADSARWPDERTVGPFCCHADFSLQDSGGLLEELVALQRDLVQSLRLRPQAEPIHLFLFAEEGTYQAYVTQYFPDVPYRRALFIKERGPGMIFAFSSRQVDVDLRHEATHALLHNSLPMVPLWLDEGLAEYFEVPAAERAYRNPHLPKVKWSIFFRNATPLEQLEEITRLQDMGAAEYRHAWAWVHFMLHGPAAAQEELMHYLSDTQAQTPPGELSRRLRRRIPDLEQRLTAHFAQWRR